VGLLVSVVAALEGFVMAGAAAYVHVRHGIFVADGGWELVGLLAVVSLALVVGGPGRLSVDRLVAGRLRGRDAGPARTEAGLAAA
jgi:putative oxidoreductase